MKKPFSITLSFILSLTLVFGFTPSFALANTPATASTGYTTSTTSNDASTSSSATSASTADATGTTTTETGDGTDQSGETGASSTGTPSTDYTDTTGNRDTSQTTTPANDSTAGTTTYKNSSTATQGNVTFTVQWNDPVAGEDTTFHITQTGGSSTAKARMDVPAYKDPDGSSESVCDPTRNDWGTYYTIGDEGYDTTFNFTASGQYYMIFYFMDTTSGVYYLRTTLFITIDDANHPAVSTIVANAVAQAQDATDGSDYKMALWLHDWELKQLDYDYSLNYCSAESGLTRGKGTCESYQRIYQKLLTKAGLQNARMTGNGHTWNAVYIEGKWCQVDVNWDDDTDGSKTKAYGFDATHLYFGLTDELMAVAHSDHTSTYQAEGYAYRSTDLSNNYFARTGKATEWAQAYTDRIQQHLDAKETSFTITSDNASLPPSINGIQNGIVAYAMNQQDWKASDGTKATLTATSNVQTQSSTSWTAVYDFVAEYKKNDIAQSNIEVQDIAYTGEALKPTVIVSYNGTQLQENVDYTLTFSDNVTPGNGTVTVNGTGNFTGSKKSQFKIVTTSIEQEFISDLYTKVLNRRPDAGGFSYYLKAFSTGKKPKEITIGFFESKEFTNRGYNNETIIQIAYDVLLNRAPDESGLNSYLKAVNEGMTIKKFISSIYSSSEFKAGHKDLLAKTYLVHIYKNALNRNPDENGLNTWLQSYKNGMPMTNIVKCFFNSTEFKKSKLSSEEIVKRVYRCVLIREADKSGLEYYSALLNKGESTNNLINYLSQSKEYSNLADNKLGFPIL